MKWLFITCFLLCAVVPVVAQSQPVKSYPELRLLLQKSKPDTSRVLVLQELVTYYCSHPNSTALDTALSLASQAEKLSLALHYPKGQATGYVLISRIYNRQGQPEKGKALLNKAIQIFNAYHYWDELGEAYFELGCYYSLSGPELNERIRLSELGLATFQRSGNPLKQANGNKELGDLYQVEGNYSKSLATLKEGLRLYQSIGYPRLHGIYDLLGNVSYSLDAPKEAIRYGLLAAETAEHLRDTSMQLATIYNRLGLTYYDIKEFEQAMVYYKKSFAIAEKYKDFNTLGILANNIANTLVQLNRPEEALALLHELVKKYPTTDINEQIFTTAKFVDIYTILKRYLLAQQYNDRLLVLTEKPGPIMDEAKQAAYQVIIKYFIASRQYNRAEEYLPLHQKLAKQPGWLINLANNHLSWFKLDSAKGQYPSAIAHYQLYKTLTDSILNESKSKQIAQLRIEYQTEKKDQDLKLQGQNIILLTKQGQLQQSQLKQANLVKNVTFGGIALLLIIISLLYNRYRLKQRSSLKLEAQQKEINAKNDSLQHLVTEKEWLLKEIHHRVKNNLQIVMSLLNSQSAYLADDVAMLAIRDSQHRVQAISLIHQKLYQSENLSAIDMPAYIRELVEYLRDIFDTGQRIRFHTQVDPVRLDVSYAVPVGLILNEAITNGIKYAFPRNREGLITISFKQANSSLYLLTVTDNGVGLPANFDSRQSNSLGMSLMRGLSDDIDGVFTIENHAGTAILISFVYEPTIRQDLVLTSSDIPSEISYE